MAEKVSADEVPPVRKAPRKPVGSGKPRGPSGGTVQTEASLERDADAMRLAVAGWSNAAIAREMGYNDGRDASKAISRHVARIVDQPARDVRQMMLEQLDQATNAVLGVLTGVHLKFHQGEPILYQPDPQDAKSARPVTDSGPILAAATTLSGLLDRKSKLLGIDAPDRQEISITQLPSYVEEWVARKRKEALGQ